ncbi:hypothetical protein AB0904_29170 [Streptomyces sp. NPDC006684]|uniref:hypothetical protein n=1 Tax=Streptomyces sp. NPDC006684 TaxID=3154477 RepID=UPI003451D59B
MRRRAGAIGLASAVAVVPRVRDADRSAGLLSGEVANVRAVLTAPRDGVLTALALAPLPARTAARGGQR